MKLLLKLLMTRRSDRTPSVHNFIDEVVMNEDDDFTTRRSEVFVRCHLGGGLDPDGPASVNTEPQHVREISTQVRLKPCCRVEYKKNMKPKDYSSV